MADKSKIGLEFPAYTFTIEKDKIIEFAIAVSQKENKEQINQIYCDEDAAKKAGYQGNTNSSDLSNLFIFLDRWRLVGHCRNAGN